MKKTKERKPKEPRNWNAVAAHFRNSKGPMKEKSEKVDEYEEYLEEKDEEETEEEEKTRTMTTESTIMMERILSSPLVNSMTKTKRKNK